MKIRKQFLTAALSAALALSMLAGCSGAPTEPSAGSASSPASGAASETEPTAANGDKTLKMYVAGFQNLDPQIWSWGTHVDRMGIFEGLTLLNSDFTTRMGNAESLEHNDDYTVWTAKIKQGLKWSDGEVLDANDYYYSFKRIIDPQYLQGKSSAFNTNPPILNALECQKGEATFDKVGIKLVDDSTIEFTLSNACTDFDVRLAESWGLPVPEQAITAYGDDWTKPENIVVNGPYIPSAREEDVHLSLAPNANYYEAPALDAIELYYGTQNQLLAYKNGDINVATILAADIEAVNKDTELASRLTVEDTSVVTYIGLLKGTNDVLQTNPKIREAISLSIDRDTIAEAISKNTVTAAKSLVYPGFASWANDLDVIKYDQAAAKECMKEAGYEDASSLSEMTILIAGTAGAETLAIADMITRGTGIKVKIVNQEWAAYVKDRDAYHEDGTWGIFIDGWNTSVANVGGAFSSYQFDIREDNIPAEAMKEFANADHVVSAEEAARQKTANPEAIEYAKKYEELLKESDPAKLDAGYKELEIIRLNSFTSIPLYWGKSNLIINPSIKGYDGNPMLLNSPPFYFKDITND